ncbi:MAG: hypothetical protein WCR45_03865 [Bacteroidaceae bacterium]
MTNYQLNIITSQRRTPDKSDIPFNATGKPHVADVSLAKCSMWL